MDAIKAAVFLLLLPLAMTIEFRALFSVLKLEKYDELEQGLENGFTEFIKTLENPQEIDFSSFVSETFIQLQITFSKMQQSV